MTQEIASIDDVTFNQDGLVPAIAQDAETGDILMMAWMNLASLQETLATGRLLLVSITPIILAQR